MGHLAVLLQLVLLLLVIINFTCEASKRPPPPKSPKSSKSSCTQAQEKKFGEFKNKFRKKYKDNKHEQQKKSSWCEKDKYIEDYNAKHKFKLRHNHLSDLSPSEIKKLNSYKYIPARIPPKGAKTHRRPLPGSHGVVTPPPTTVKPTEPPTTVKPIVPVITVATTTTTTTTTTIPPATTALVAPTIIPAAVNWTAKGVSVVVKNQGLCGSCYAFAAMAALEAKYQIETGVTYDLSEEFAIDCSSDNTYYNQWCNGGMFTSVFKYVADKGVYTEAQYPYGSQAPPTSKPACTSPGAPTIPPLPAGSLGYQWILNDYETTKVDIFMVYGLNNAGDENVLKTWVTKQPVVASMHSSLPDFMSYSGGHVYSNSSCPNAPGSSDHAVLIVGYGTDATGMDYWIIKNSWGGWPSCTTGQTCWGWGDGGYALIQRGVNMCGIANNAAIPTST